MELETVKEAPGLQGKLIYVIGCSMGCDPEFFLEQDGKVVGSELTIPENGLDCTQLLTKEQLRAGYRQDLQSKQAKLVQDGVQVELNPNPSHCRQTLTSEMSVAFKTLKDHLKKTKGLTASFKSVIEMDPVELAKLSEKAKILGCAPSMNAHKTSSINVADASKYMKRSAGGHFHFGTKDIGLKASPDQIATAMDTFVGLASVLMDRDPEAAERRKLYGRAGEYRTPRHGFEYRTCSNFWLRDSKIMSALLGLGRMAISTLYTGTTFRKLSPMYQYPQYDWDPEEELYKLVDIKAVKEAINSNNLELAKETFKGVKTFIKRHVPAKVNTGLDPTTLKAFDYFIHMIDLHGLWYWFQTDPIDHWTNLKGVPQGFESYLAQDVSRLMNKDTEWLSSYQG